MLFHKYGGANVASTNFMSHFYMFVPMWLPRTVSICRYLEMIGAPTTVTTSGHHSHHFGPLYSSNNDAATLHQVIAALCMRQKSICECCGRIGHKADACIIRGTKFFPPSLRIKMNQFNALNGDKPKEPPR